MSKRLFLLIFIFLFTYNCSKTKNPRVVVMDFIEAVNRSDTISIEEYLDLDRFTQEKTKEIPEPEKQRIIPVIKEQLKSNFLGSGATRLKWQDKMIVVNKEEVQGDSALVEVTFIDQKTSITDYTKAKLYKKENRWWIYYIKD